MWDEREYQPDFDADERTRAAEPNRTLARDRARALLKAQRVATPPVDVEAIISARGLTLIRVQVNGRLSGQLYPNVREIVINTRERSDSRQRFTMAHELGHWELGHYLRAELPDDTLGFAGAYEGSGGSDGRSAIEIEANAFAAELLMPGAWLRKLSKPLRPGAPDELASIYGVSREAMFYQLMHCGRL